MQPSPGRVLRTALAAHEIVVAPGVYDAITARLVERNGFGCAYVTGAGTTNASLGLPDIGLLTLSEMAQTASRITSVVSIPVIADADTGYGTSLNSWRTVREFERAGLAGLHLEDQDGVKRCGHLEGKTLVPTETMCEKIAVACGARNDPDFVIVARTDAAAIEGVDNAIIRAHAYIDAGADMIFVEALRSRSEFDRAARAITAVPLIANMTEFGKTPLLSARDFQDLGYAMVIFPMTAFRLMLRAVDEGLAELAATGTQQGLLSKMRTREELYELIDYARFTAMEEPLHRAEPGDRGA